MSRKGGGRGRKSPVQQDTLPECEGVGDWVSKKGSRGRKLPVQLPEFKEEDGSIGSSEWMSSLTATGRLKLVKVVELQLLVRLEAEPSSTSNSNSFSACSGNGELGTRGLNRLHQRQRRKILKDASVEVDRREEGELEVVRQGRREVGWETNPTIGQTRPKSEPSRDLNPGPSTIAADALPTELPDWAGILT